jgi:hypothetical protein
MDGSKPLFSATAMMSHHMSDQGQTTVVRTYEDWVKKCLNQGNAFQMPATFLGVPTAAPPAGTTWS